MIINNHTAHFDPYADAMVVMQITGSDLSSYEIKICCLLILKSMDLIKLNP